METKNIKLYMLPTEHTRLEKAQIREKEAKIEFCQSWIDKIIKEGRMDLLPSSKPEDGLSIGEYLEKKYKEAKEYPKPKITENNSFLIEREWIEKFKQEDIVLPKYKNNGLSYTKQLKNKYLESEMRKYFSMANSEVISIQEQFRKLINLNIKDPSESDEEESIERYIGKKPRQL